MNDLILITLIFQLLFQSVGFADENQFLHFQTEQNLEYLSSNDYLSEFSKRQQDLMTQGYQIWSWPNSECQSCDFMILPTRQLMTSQLSMRFINTLIGEKNNILKLYKINTQEYIFLAQLAVALLGAESYFFQNQNYLIKEQITPLRQLIKKFRAIVLKKSYNLPSRGPTQIKIIPMAIAQHYQVTPPMLYIPEYAAVATMGYLIESLKELKQRIKNNKLTHIQPENYVQNLALMYIGLTKKILSPTENLNNNYVTHVLTYFKWTRVFVKNQSTDSKSSN